MKVILNKGFLPKVLFVLFSMFLPTDFARPGVVDCAKFYGPSAAINSAALLLKDYGLNSVCDKIDKSGLSLEAKNDTQGIILNVNHLLRHFIPYFTNDLAVKASPFLKRLKSEDPLFQSIRDISKKMGVSCPKVYLFESETLIASFVGLNDLVISRGVINLLTEQELVAFIGSMLGACLGSSAWLNDDLISRLLELGEKSAFCLIDQVSLRWITRTLDFQSTRNVFAPDFEVGAMADFAKTMNSSFNLDYNKDGWRFAFLLGYYSIKKFVLKSLFDKISNQIELKNAHRGDAKSIELFDGPEDLISALEKLKKAKFFEGPSLGEFLMQSLVEGTLGFWADDLSLINNFLKNKFPKQYSGIYNNLFGFAPARKVSNQKIAILKLDQALKFYQSFSKANKNWLVDGRIKRIKAMMSVEQRQAQA